MKHKLSIILTLIIMMFLNISDVGAYGKPSGRFSLLIGEPGSSGKTKLHYLDSEGGLDNRGLSVYAVPSAFVDSYNSSNSGESVCYLNYLSTTTNHVYFNNIEYTSLGSTLQRVWKEADDSSHNYLVGCYRTNLSSANAKFYFMGFTSKYNPGCSSTNIMRVAAYVYAGQTNKNGVNVREKDYKNGYGKTDTSGSITIGASWACQGKGTSGYDECKKNSGEKFTDRYSCPLYAGVKEDGSVTKFYLTNNTSTDFKEKGFYASHLCIGYDKVIDDFIDVALVNYEKIFKDKTGDIEDNYNPGVNMLNVHQLVKSYENGDITLKEVQNKYSVFIATIYKEMYMNKLDIVEKVTFNKNNFNSFELGDLTEFGGSICKNYIEYLDNKIKEKIDDFAETLANKLFTTCIKTSTRDGSTTDTDIVSNLKEIVKSRGSFILIESDFNGLGLTSDEKSCLLKVSEAAENVSSVIEREHDKTTEAWIKKADEFLNDGFTGQGISDKKMTCEDLLGPNLVKIVKFVVKLLSIVGAIIAIVNAMISLVPAVVSKDADALKKAQSKCITMAIVLVLILLLPTLLTFIGNIFGYDLSCLQWLSGE